MVVTSKVSPACMVPAAGERRAQHRRLPQSDEPLARIRMRTGPELTVIDVSPSGALVEGHVRLALLRSQTRDKDGAQKALAEALDTWRQIPPYQRRRQLRWWFRAQLARFAI